jgi:hypothetical protein
MKEPNKSENIVWDDINGYEGIYQISKRGTIRSRWENNAPNGWIIGKEWSQVKHSDAGGGPIVSLAGRNGISKKFSVARLVLETFGDEKPSPKHQALRKDGNTQNVVYSNLVWGSVQERSNSAAERGTIAKGTDLPQAELTAEDVTEIKEELVNGYLTLTDIGELYNVSPKLIFKIKEDNTWKHIPWPPGEINKVFLSHCDCCGTIFEQKRFKTGSRSKVCSPLCRQRFYYLKYNNKSYREVYGHRDSEKGAFI